MVLAPEYLADDTVDDALDAEIRTLLTTCFTKPQDVVFKDHRYFKEPYQHRWVIKNEKGALVAQAGVHDKQIQADGTTYRIAGIGDVCVHPAYRGRGYVRMMLKCIHDWAPRQGFDFAVLFGDPKVYGSSGYVHISNLFRDAEQPGGGTCRKQISAMVRQLSGTPWPGGEVFLPGKSF